jgi:hypothetical protein
MTQCSNAKAGLGHFRLDFSGALPLRHCWGQR